MKTAPETNPKHKTSALLTLQEGNKNYKTKMEKGGGKGQVFVGRRSRRVDVWLVYSVAVNLKLKQEITQETETRMPISNLH